MPRNGAGAYSLPTGNPVVTGTAISSTVQNNTMTDVATALTQSLAKDGQTTPSANLPMGSYRHTGVGNGVARTDYPSIGQVQDGSFMWCGTATGTANALLLVPTPIVPAITAGQRFVFKSGASPNSGATTASISTLPTIAVQVNGAACVGGEILANKWYEVLVDASATSCQLNNIGQAAMDTTTTSIDANAWNTNGTVVSYASSATNTPTNAGILTHHCATGGTADGFQLWQNFSGNGNTNMWSRQRWGGAWTAWEAIAGLGANTFTADQVINGLEIGRGAGNIATNTAFGDTALDSNTTGNSNTAIGLNALTANTVGLRNVAVGASALVANTSGIDNTAVGVGTLANNIIGSQNTAVGENALGVGTGGGNTAVGYQAGVTLTTGQNDTLIGFNAAPSAVTVSNEITLGNGSVATLRCQVTSITALSDARDKADIAPLAAGLDFVQRLKPVSYVWNMRDGGKVGIPDTGFIAQELKQVQIDTGIDIPGLVYEENPDRLEAAYGKLLPVMVKAIQELSAKVEALNRIVNNC